MRFDHVTGPLRNYNLSWLEIFCGMPLNIEANNCKTMDWLKQIFIELLVKQGQNSVKWMQLFSVNILKVYSFQWSKYCIDFVKTTLERNRQIVNSLQDVDIDDMVPLLINTKSLLHFYVLKIRYIWGFTVFTVFFRVSVMWFRVESLGERRFGI